MPRGRPYLRRTSAAALLVFLFACRPRQVTVDYLYSPDHTFTRAERRAIEEVAEQTLPEVRRVLPGVPDSIVIRVSTSSSVNPETGENGEAARPNVVYWEVDPGRKEGVEGVVRTQLRATLFHELHHLVRVTDLDGSESRLRARVVDEGLATAFERDFGGASPLWGQYPPEVSSWAKEVLALPDDAPKKVWLFDHPDGRRWIGFRVGTYLADCAKNATGKTSADLVGVPADAVIAMCPKP